MKIGSVSQLFSCLKQVCVCVRTSKPERDPILRHLSDGEAWRFSQHTLSVNNQCTDMQCDVSAYMTHKTKAHSYSVCCNSMPVL